MTSDNFVACHSRCRFLCVHTLMRQVCAFFSSSSIQSRLALRRELNCKSFQWYLDHVYPELKKPDGGHQTDGVFKQGLKCLDTLGHHSEGTVGIFTCHGNGGNQVLLVLGKKVPSLECLKFLKNVTN